MGEERVFAKQKIAEKKKVLFFKIISTTRQKKNLPPWIRYPYFLKWESLLKCPKLKMKTFRYFYQNSKPRLPFLEKASES